MLILAVETSGPELSVALVKDGELVSELSPGGIGFTHSERLMPLIESLLKDAGLHAGDIDVFAASSGPGSFTGVRIGIISVKAMAYALGKPVIGVPTLDALAMNAGVFAGEGENRVCALIDARNGQVYSGTFRFEDGMPVLIDGYGAGDISDLASALAITGERTALVGSGVEKHRRILETSSPSLFLPGSPESNIPHARMVGKLAYEMALKGKTLKAEELVPLYVRKSQAERKKDHTGYHG